MLLLRYLTPLALCLVLVGKSAAHPGQADPVEYPFVAGFDRFYSAEDDEDHLAQGGMLLLQEFNCTGCHVAPKAGGSPGNSP
ncbi:hypothetical protein [Verrucomicrobium spinosum]|uniref:hypothetical protein n=1 Tax=Verrucomicrobium spinosum TaxID=2736 RepID=UPI000B2E627D|nr:hypothetical protein [Verrucomicrobium spinosum]